MPEQVAVARYFLEVRKGEGDITERLAVLILMWL